MHLTERIVLDTHGEVCFAHLSENGERKETLREHTELCQKYWKEIVKRKKIDEIFQEFENVYLEELSKESRNLFELMTVNIVSVHDLGKMSCFSEQCLDMRRRMYLDFTS